MHITIEAHLTPQKKGEFSVRIVPKPYQGRIVANGRPGLGRYVVSEDSYNFFLAASNVGHALHALRLIYTTGDHSK